MGGEVAGEGGAAEAETPVSLAFTDSDAEQERLYGRMSPPFSADAAVEAEIPVAATLDAEGFQPSTAGGLPLYAPSCCLQEDVAHPVPSTEDVLEFSPDWGDSPDFGGSPGLEDGDGADQSPPNRSGAPDSGGSPALVDDEVPVPSMEVLMRPLPGDVADSLCADAECPAPQSFPQVFGEDLADAGVWETRLLSVQAYEKKYVQKQKDLAVMACLRHAAEVRRSHPVEHIVSTKRGFDAVRQQRRRSEKLEMMNSSAAFQEARRHDLESLRALGQELVGVAPAQDLLKTLGSRLAQFSQDALRLVGEAKGGKELDGIGEVDHHPNYAQLLAAEKLIILPEPVAGRKPSAAVEESPLGPEEEAYDGTLAWVDWWLRLGKFPTPDSVDSKGWLPLHHAADATTYSQRAMRVALPLVCETTDVNLVTKSGRPTGYTPLHMACFGSDREFRRIWLVAALLERRAEIEKRDASGNTPLLKAAGTGVTDVVKLLIEKTADIHVRNNRGVGALEMAKGSSSHTGAALEAAGCTMTKGQAARRQRRTTPAARQTRYALSAADPGSVWSKRFKR